MYDENNGNSIKWSRKERGLSKCHLFFIGNICKYMFSRSTCNIYIYTYKVGEKYRRRQKCFFFRKYRLSEDIFY